MIKLNESAGAIGQYIDGTNNVSAIIAQLKQQFVIYPKLTTMLLITC